jgi:Domain of unknown function (DUF4157)
MSGAEHAAKQRRPRLEVVEAAEPVARTAAPTLTVGHAFDPAEHEADRVADQVMARLRDGDGADVHDHSVDGSHGVQREAISTEAPVVGKEGGALPGELSSRIESKRGGGTRLDAGVRGRMESAFGADLGDVRVHADNESAALSRSISARAFTTGKDIFFGAGEFRPDTPAGERTLAHELAHTRQQGGVQRTSIHRLWNLKAKELRLDTAIKVRALVDRPIYFLQDMSGDEVVVKSEDQPVGLGQLVGSMQKTVAGVKNVDQRKLTNGERQEMDVAVAVSEVIGFDPSWAKRGAYLKANGGDASKSDEDLAFQDAQQVIADKKRNLMVMGFAEGQSADKVAKETTGPVGGKISPIRGLLEDRAHLKAIGNMTAVDLFMGNLDRFYSGNIGNWFYDPAGSIVAIDNVDGSQLNPTTTGMKMPKQWEQMSYGGYELKNDLLRATASEGLRQTASNAENTSDDKTLFTWWSAKDATGTKRREDAITAVVEGLQETKKKIVKIFSATRFTVGGKKNRATKKAIKGQAAAAAETDSDDDNMQGGLDYYNILKDRAKWLAKN